MRDLSIAIAAVAAVMSSAGAAADTGCPDKVSPELETSLGAPTGWLGAGETVHNPAGLTALGLPVSYALVRRTGGEAGAIAEIDYRIQGASRPFGQRYALDLRKAFDQNFDGTNCGSKEGVSCAVDYTGASTGRLHSAELSAGDLSIPKDAHGDSLPLVKADYDLDGAEPVFLACIYDSGS
jgi:hypothetical protein